MAFSPASSIGNIGHKEHLTIVYLSRLTGYDVSIIANPNVVDPAWDAGFSVLIKREDGEKAVIGTFTNKDDLSKIVKDIKAYKWSTVVSSKISVATDRPAADLVEYILKFKAKQEKKNGKASVPVNV